MDNINEALLDPEEVKSNMVKQESINNSEIPKTDSLSNKADPSDSSEGEESENLESESEGEGEESEEEFEIEEEEPDTFFTRLGRPEYYHLWAIFGCAFEAIVNIGLGFLSIFAAYDVEFKSNCDVQVFNILNICSMFLILVRLNSVLHVIHFLWNYKLSGLYIPIALFFTELVTTAALLGLKFYWEGRERSCQQNLGYFLVIIYDSLFYFFATRTAFFLLAPCFFLCYLCIASCYARRQRNRRTRKFRKLPTYKFVKYQQKYGEVKHKECWICLEEYKDTDDIYEFPCESKHLFHKHCIKQWYEKSDSCPVDRSRYSE